LGDAFAQCAILVDRGAERFDLEQAFWSEWELEIGGDLIAKNLSVALGFLQHERLAAGGVRLLGRCDGGIDIAAQRLVHHVAFHMVMGGEGTDVQSVNAGLSRSVHPEREETECAGDAAEDADQDEETGAKSKFHG
jgi:hypothetical protein